MTETVTPIETTPDAGMAGAEAAAERELSELFSQPEPAQVVTEQTATTAPQEPAPTAAPTEPPQEGIKPAEVQPSPLDDPTVKKALDFYQGDIKAAAEGFLSTNTRAAQMAAKLKELGIDPNTLAQVAPQRAVEQTQQVQELTPEFVTTEVNRLLDSDPNFNSLVQAYGANDTRLSQINAENKELDDKVARATLALSIPEIKNDAFKADEYLRELTSARAEKLRLQLETSILEGKQERLNAAARTRSEAARTAVTQHFGAQAQKAREEAELLTSRAQAKEEFATAWPQAVDRAIKDHSIPADLVEDFREETKIAALAHLAREGADPINDVNSFVGSRAKILMERYERYHRVKSADYAKAAIARTAVATSPAPGAPGQAKPATAPKTYNEMNPGEAEAALIEDGKALWGTIFAR